MNESKKVILFDFDGVLIDALAHAFEIHKAVNPHFTWEEFEEMSVGNFHEKYQEKLASGDHVNPDNFYGQYSETLKNVSIADQMALLVEFLAKKYVLYIVSSTNSDVISDLLERENILAYFEKVLGHDVHASKEVKIKNLLKENNFDPKVCLMITDTTGDIKEARECNVTSIGVLWGLHKKDRLEKENPFMLVETPQQLEDAIERYFSTI